MTQPKRKPEPPKPPPPAPKPPTVQAAPKPPQPHPAAPPPKPREAPAPPAHEPPRAPEPPSRTTATPRRERPSHEPIKTASKPPPTGPRPQHDVTVVAHTASYDSDQIKNQKIVVALMESNHVPELGIIAGLCAGAGENNWHTDGCNSSDHCGFWQLDSDWQKMHDYHDVEYWTRYAIQHGFYGHGGLSHIAKTNPSLSPGWVAQYCQGAGPTDAAAAAYYDSFVGVAHAVYDRYKSGATPIIAPPGHVKGLPLPAPAYVNPLGDANVTPSRIDQGCDFAGTGHYGCFAACVITAATNNTSGWTSAHPGGYVEYKVTQPGPFQGDYFYCAEGITTHRKVGDKLSAGEWICSLRAGWPTATEIGQAAGDGTERTWAAVFGGGYSEGDCTAAGRAFAKLLGHLGVNNLPVCQGPLTGLWPRWATDGKIPDLSGAIAVGGGGSTPARKPSESASKAASSYTWPTDQLQEWAAFGHGAKAAADTAANLKKYVSGVTFVKSAEGKQQ